jgi:hypothetical protein
MDFVESNATRANARGKIGFPFVGPFEDAS